MLEIISLICKRHIAGEVLPKFGLYLAPTAFERGGIFIVPRLLWHGASVFAVSSERSLNLVVCTTNKGPRRPSLNWAPTEISNYAKTCDCLYDHLVYPSDYDVGKASICHRTSKMQHAASCMYVTDTDGCNIHQLYNNVNRAYNYVKLSLCTLGCVHLHIHPVFNALV